MWIKAAVLGGSGIVFCNLAVWTMAGLGITLAFQSSRKWVNSVVAREEKDNEIDRLPDKENDNEIDRLPDDINIVSQLRHYNEIDRLPDDILGDIVSRLTLIEASGTSILSRRWRNLWTMKSDLVFTCASTFTILNEYHTHVANGSFLKAVDQCLQLYSDHGRSMQVILLPCCFLNGDTCHLVRWMKTLVRLDVENIILGSPCDTCNRAIPEKEYTFSFNLIDGLCRLKHLRLFNCYVETSFVGQCISLTRIYMGFLLLLSHQLSDILMSCPNLGILSIVRCELPLNVRISGSNLKLKHVEIVVCSNVEKIEISDTNVMTAYIDVRSEVEILLSSLPKMKELNLRAKELNLRAPGTEYRFWDVTRDLPELEVVMIRTPYQFLRLPPTFRAFRNIRILNLLTSGNNPRPEGSEKLDLWNFAPVLDAFPFLENFFLAIGGHVCNEERKAKWPVARHKHLRYVELSGFSNTQNELEFARFILSSAQVLRNLILLVCPRICNYVEGRIKEPEKDSKPIDAGVAQAVYADLQGYALSNHARVTLL